MIELASLIRDPRNELQLVSGAGRKESLRSRRRPSGLEVSAAVERVDSSVGEGGFLGGRVGD